MNFWRPLEKTDEKNLQFEEPSRRGVVILIRHPDVGTVKSNAPVTDARTPGTLRADAQWRGAVTSPASSATTPLSRSQRIVAVSLSRCIMVQGLLPHRCTLGIAN